MGQIAFLVTWNSQNTTVMKNPFSTQAAMAAGVAFQTHHVVPTFHTKKARKASQNTWAFSPLAILFSRNKRGIKAIKTKGAKPREGHAIVNNKPLSTANPTRWIFFMGKNYFGKNTKSLLPFHLNGCFGLVLHGFIS